MWVKSAQIGIGKGLVFMFLAIFGLLVSHAGQAKDVPVKDAQTVGTTFLEYASRGNLVCDSLVLLKQFNSFRSTKSTGGQSKSLYIFAISPSPGFIIVSADDRVKPVLGYSLSTEFIADELPPNFQEWLLSYIDQIEVIATQDLSPSKEIDNAWGALKAGIPNRNLKSGATVSPLISTTWNQGDYYNELCPYDETEGRYTYTGCVATCMAQIMKYWVYPTQGQGSHSYQHADYGEQSANFGETTYNWSGMPNSLSGSNEAVATLMYHCGVSVDMNYGTDGSGAVSSKVVSALYNYYKYSSDVSITYRSSYTNEQWKDLVISDLYSGRPIYYTGRHANGGHAFICDGYDGDYFHFNWGWGGYYDGWFSIDNLNPGTRTYNDSQSIIYQIFPESSGNEEPVLTVDPLTRSVGPAKGSTSFDVSNTGTGTMNWTASFIAGDTWAHIGSGSSGTDSGTISLTIDANESNDSRTATILITASGATGSPKEVTIVQEKAAGQPDIYISNLTTSLTAVKPLGVMAGHFVFGNQGQADMPASHYRYAISDDQSYSTDDYLVQYGELDALAAGYENTGGSTGDFQLPASIVTGTWYLIVMLECDAEVEEENENNNNAVVQ